MPRHFPLTAVLAVRQQKEEVEERALGAISLKIADMRTALARVDAELVRHAAVRAAEVSAVHNAAHHLAAASRWKVLGDARAHLQADLKQLELQRSEQMTRFLAARSDREMLSELRSEQKRAWNAELESREAKQVADLFASRRFRA